jgi:hypothetical protein
MVRSQQCSGSRSIQNQSQQACCLRPSPVNYKQLSAIAAAAAGDWSSTWSELPTAKTSTRRGSATARVWAAHRQPEAKLYLLQGCRRCRRCRWMQRCPHVLAPGAPKPPAAAARHCMCKVLLSLRLSDPGFHSLCCQHCCCPMSTPCKQQQLLISLHISINADPGNKFLPAGPPLAVQRVRQQHAGLRHAVALQQRLPCSGAPNSPDEAPSEAPR